MNKAKQYFLGFIQITHRRDSISLNHTLHRVIITTLLVLYNMHLSYLSLYDVNCPFSQNGPDFKLGQKARCNRNSLRENSTFFAYFLKET